MTRRHGAKHFRENLLRKVGKHIVQGDDGFWIFWPTENEGAYCSRSLRLIAAHLDHLNKPVEAQLKEVMEAPLKFAASTGHWMNGARYRK